jgi:hypothetical protein
VTITTDDTTYYAPPPWIDLDAVLPAELRDRIAEVRAESLTLFPAVKAWSEKARALGWEVQEHIEAQVEAVERSLDLADWEPLEITDGLGLLLSIATGWANVSASANRMGSMLEMVGSPEPEPMTAEQIAGVEAIRAQEVQAAQG